VGKAKKHTLHLKYLEAAKDVFLGILEDGHPVRFETMADGTFTIRWWTERDQVLSMRAE
jgi:hypothetical protein